MLESYRNYFEQLPCYVTVQDKDLRIVDANRKFENDFGDYSERYCYQVYKHRPTRCEICPVLHTFRDGVRRSSEELVRTLEGREVSVLVNTTPIRDGNGDIVAVMEMSTDITDIKALQKELRDSQDRYRLLFEEVPCYISIQDSDLRIIEANRLHRETFGTYYGCKCFKVYKHREKACFPCVVKQTFEDGEIHRHEEVVTSQDGRTINVMVTTAPIYNAESEIEAVMEMSADITQIRALQSKLSSIGLLISSLSHDLKGLLNGLDGGVYLVDTGLKKSDQERVEKGWEMVTRNVGQIRSAVLDILYYARDREPEWENVVADDVLADVFEIMKSKASEQGIEFVRDQDGVVGQFEADCKALRSLLVNLIDNSFDACRVDKSKEQHRVTVGLRGTADHVIYEVSDNGIGMKQEVREKAFTLFFSSKGAGGTGLGLFVANKIAQSHDGEILIESEEGHGCKFIVKLPRRRQDRPAVDSESE
jgi:PAS domain S-box-containing protein